MGYLNKMLIYTTEKIVVDTALNLKIHARIEDTCQDA
jgi:hypothetical protein